MIERLAEGLRRRYGAVMLARWDQRLNWVVIPCGLLLIGLSILSGWVFWQDFRTPGGLNWIDLVLAVYQVTILIQGVILCFLGGFSIRNAMRWLRRT